MTGVLPMIAPVWQDPWAEQEHDRDRSREQGNPDDGELDEADPADARLLGGLRDEHAHW